MTGSKRSAHAKVSSSQKREDQNHKYSTIGRWRKRGISSSRLYSVVSKCLESILDDPEGAKNEKNRQLHEVARSMINTGGHG